MSSLSMPRPKKVSDGQFIGDLTKLLERRKIKCGDPHSLETFGSELSSNNILRSDLFTLCTAISHMADEDLSGEQLLVLVARALGGPEVCNGDGTAAVPDSVRSAFLSGYEAWGNRGNEMNEPLPWPPPRPAVNWSEPLATTQASREDSEPGASKVPTAGVRTMQEALDLVKKRSPIAMPAERSSALGANIEGLTISELKTLLDDIEDRMSRLQPHLRELSSIVRSPVEDAKRRDPTQVSDGVRPSRVVVPLAESEVPFSSALRSPLVDARTAIAATDPPAGVTAGLGSTSATLNEAAFFERHPYLRPKRRAGADLHVVPTFDPATAPVDAVPAAAAAAGQIVALHGAAVASPAAALASPVSAAAAVPLAAPAPTPIATTTERNGAAVARTAPISTDPSAAPNPWHVTPHMLGAAAAGLLILPTMFAGVIAYRYFHPPYAIKYLDHKPPATSQAADLTAVPLAGALPAAPGTTPAATSHPQVSAARSQASTARQARQASQQPAVSVWPPPPQVSAGGGTPASDRPLIASAPSSLPRPGGGANAPRAAGSMGPHYVPSSTMIQYAVSAPKPIYPVDKARADGIVVLQITISRQGEVVSTRTVSGPAELRSAAVQAVRAWHFKPYLLDGNPTEVVTTLELPFKRP